MTAPIEEIDLYNPVIEDIQVKIRIYDILFFLDQIFDNINYIEWYYEDEKGEVEKNLQYYLDNIRENAQKLRSVVVTRP